ncbi:DUF4054 domain-containing protein [Caulobacter hibisci]|uniref:DUF4054 domain-containing protein n=1 Tax=Caulobacter hibisci TaxID=2035993 RepID=A0ABS0SRY7_9CAUL|nr:DUF4054 domain-containing protein [Caulobacter hibisci]MBI1682382.1 DUF4054 domain-containing protein [Caulobacter hibisci]
MAYNAPTLEDFRARFPRATGAVVSDAMVTQALARAARQVDTSWTEGDFAEGQLLYAAAWLTKEGFWPGAEGEAAAAGASGFKVMKSGQLSLERFDNGASSGGQTDPVLATGYGQEFATLRFQNVGGPRVTGAGTVPYSGGWPWAF